MKAKPPDPDPDLVSRVTRDRGSHHPSRNLDEDMLFSRLRSQMRWAFIITAVIFAVLFIVFGVLK